MAAVKTIPLSRGLFALVDEADHALVGVHRWYAQRSGKTFAACRWVGGRKNRRLLWLHRVLLDAPAGTIVDHVNGDPLDNRRANLRFADAAGNARNVHRGMSRFSPYKGVRFIKAGRRKWSAEIRAGGRRLYLGVFHTPEEAARAYDAAARAEHGAFAWLNFPDARQPAVPP